MLGMILPYLMGLYKIENKITSDHLGFDFNLVKGLAQSSKVRFQHGDALFSLCGASYPRQ